MPQTIAVRVSERTLAALQRGESVRVRLDRSNVVGGVTRTAGRPPGRKPRPGLWWKNGGLPQAGSAPANLLLWAVANGGTVDSRQARTFLRGSRVYSSGVLSKLALGGLLRREHWGRYAVSARGRAARAALSDAGLYRRGTQRRRLAEWAIERQSAFDVVDVGRLLGISHRSVHTVLKRLVRDRVIERESPGVYRAK